MRTRTSATFLRVATLLCLTFAAFTVARAQANPTDTQTMRLSAFAGANGTITGLSTGRNLGITAGVDLGLRSFFGIHPALELRGTLPVDNGSIDSQKNALGGIQLEKSIGRIHPYVDGLFGRGEINYQSPGYLNSTGTLYYLQSLSNVFAFGGGADVNLTHHFAFKADFQLQHYQTPVSASGSLYAKALTAAVVYRFDFNHHPKNRTR